METVIEKLYEAMFLVDSAQAAADWDAVLTTIRSVLERAEAEIVSIGKWDERKLAYEINGKTRGTYILCYFKAGGERIRDIERDVQLSEQIMRVLILSTEAMNQEDIESNQNLALQQPGPVLQKDRKIETPEIAREAPEKSGTEPAAGQPAETAVDGSEQSEQAGTEHSRQEAEKD